MYESVATLIFRNQKVTYDGFNNDTYFPETGSFCQVTALTVMRINTINKAELKIIQTLFLSSGLLSMLTEGFSILHPGSCFGLKENLIPATLIEERKVITLPLKASVT